MLAHSRADSPDGSDPAGTGQTNARRAVRPVDRFYRVTFADERGFELWAERVVEFALALEDLLPTLDEMRPVVFARLGTPRAAPPQAYVSAGARGLAPPTRSAWCASSSVRKTWASASATLRS